MRRIYRCSMAVAIALGAAGTAAAQAVDNPMYQQWAAWREGASVTLRSETVIGGKALGSQTITHTLKKLTAEKAVIEVSVEVDMGGQKFKTPPQSVEYLARLPKIDPKYIPKTDPNEQVPKVKMTEGRETLTVNGRKVDCTWVQSEVEGSVTKAWQSNDVPGRMVKSVVTSPGNNLTATTQLIVWTGTKR